MLPRMDGLQICRRLRDGEHYTPILMLTAKSSEIDRVLGLELGADDYLTKPFSMLELAARLKGMFRRAEQLAAAKVAAAAAPVAAELIEVAGLRIDMQRHEARVGGKAVELTAKEFELLAFFARAPGRVFTRAQLLDQVWGYSHSGYEHTVNSHINRLRKLVGTPKHALHTRREFEHAERFGQVVVGAEFQAEHAIEFRRLGGEHQDRRVALRGAQPPANLQPVQTRQHQVEDDEVVAPRLGLGQAGDAVGDQPGLVVEFGKLQRHDAADVGVVFDDQHTMGHWCPKWPTSMPAREPHRAPVTGRELG